MAKLIRKVRKDIANRAAMDLFALPLREAFSAVEQQIIDVVKSAYSDFDYERHRHLRRILIGTLRFT